MEKKGKFLVSILFLVILTIFTGTVSAADLNVINENGIQAGVDGASVNDTNSTTATLMATALSDPGVQSVDADAADTTGPVVVSRDPANNTVNVPSNKTIITTFNENIRNGTGWIELLNSNGTVIPANLSVSGSVLTVIPVNSLAEDRYSFCIHTGSVTDLEGNLVASSVSYFIVGVSPLISTIDPVDGAVNVTLDKTITVTFNEPVKVGSGSIELCNSTNTSITVPITTSINGNVLTITPSGLLVNGTRYFLCLHTGCVTDLAGNPLAPILKSFTTSNDGTAPTITSRDPANNAVNVPSNKTITITFNENIRNGTGWIELKNNNGTVIPTNLSVNGGVLTVIPVNSLAEDRYSFCIHTGSVTDLAGNLVASSVSYFIAGVSPLISTIDPVDGATNVTLDKIITITFNEPVKVGSGSIELCNLTNTSITVPITTSINGNVLTITHSGLLAPGTHYGLCLHTGCVTDLAGNPLAPILKSFTTSNDGTAPTITSRDPNNNQIDVPSNTIIRITFNENIRNGTGWIELKNSNGTTILTSMSINGKMLTVTPVNSLIVDNYTFLIHTGSVTDLAGNPVAGIPSYFSVGTPRYIPNL